MEEKQSSTETLAHNFWQSFQLKTDDKAIDGSNHTTTIIAYKIVFNLGELVRPQTQKISSSLW